ncbi:MAG TPA: hypothetical protein VFQ61_12615 [Polyangiaceae bacterium]|nr:hypothetical protein [Polyangiaceae bacterium]
MAIDRTGELNWPYGAEDVAGDGLAGFATAERKRDARTVYATTDNERLWVRLYVSDPGNPPNDLTAFLFVDADRNALSGGPARGAELDAKLPADPTPGGYEYALAFRGDGSAPRIWTWQPALASFQSTLLNASDADAEIGAEVDPIRLFDEVHGYLQVSLRQALVALSGVCDGRLFLRTINESGAEGGQDVDVGAPFSCVADDLNQDRVPDVVVTSACQVNAQCPAGGVCAGGRCVVAAPCVDDGDCPADAACSSSEWCVARPGGSCSTNASCADLVCRANRCDACSPSGSECGAGRVCALDGRCVGASGPSALPPALSPGEKVEGGALHCGLSRPAGASTRGQALGIWFLVGLSIEGLRRWRRSSQMRRMNSDPRRGGRK